MCQFSILILPIRLMFCLNKYCLMNKVHQIDWIIENSNSSKRVKRESSPSINPFSESQHYGETNLMLAVVWAGQYEGVLASNFDTFLYLTPLPPVVLLLEDSKQITHELRGSS